MIELLLFTPIVLGLIVFIAKSRAVNTISTLLYAGLLLIISIMLYMHPASYSQYFRVDDLNILFLIVLAVLFAGIAVFNTKFFTHDKEENKRQIVFTIYLLIFIGSMAGVILTTHLALLWVFIEATTLSSAFLIYYYKTRTSMEAAWKYLFICSIGIAIAFIGIILLSMGLGNVNSFFFKDLVINAKLINPFWLKLAFPFILVGFGTKVGFAPMHTWKPDAYAEAPSPVSALLAGALLNAALLGILRINRVMEAADMGWYVQMLLFLAGFLSLFVSAVYIRIVKNYKRILAYSSVENIGIIFIGLAAGGIGYFAAILHIISHSLAKSSLFLTAGNILYRYKTKETGLVSGLLKGDALTGWIWIFSLIAIMGIPPFPLFLSEFFIIKALFGNGQYALAVIFFLLLTIILAAMARNMLKMSFGEDTADAGAKPSGLTVCIPQIIFLIILLVMGVALPDFVYIMIQKAAMSL